MIKQKSCFTPTERVEVVLRLGRTRTRWATLNRHQQYTAIDATIRMEFEGAQAEGLEALAAFGPRLDAAERQKSTIAATAGHTLEAGDEYAEMRLAVQNAQGALASRREAQELHRQLRIGSPLEATTERLDRLRAIIQLRDYRDYLEEQGLDLEGMLRALDVAHRRWFDPLWEQMPSDKAAFIELYDFIADQWEGQRTTYCSKAGRQAFIQAGFDIDVTGWNDAVTRHIAVPALGDFVGQHPVQRAGVVLGIAARALDSGSLTSARIALAYCNFNNRYAAELGPLREQLSMWADLQRRNPEA